LIKNLILRLIQEVEDLHGMIQDLLRTKSTLEHDLSVKNNSLHIDRERCLGNRRTYPSIQAVSYPTTTSIPFQSQVISY
jgi:tektin-3